MSLPTAREATEAQLRRWADSSGILALATIIGLFDGVMALLFEAKRALPVIPPPPHTPVAGPVLQTDQLVQLVSPEVWESIFGLASVMTLLGVVVALRRRSEQPIIWGLSASMAANATAGVLLLLWSWHTSPPYSLTGPCGLLLAGATGWLSVVVVSRRGENRTNPTRR